MVNKRVLSSASIFISFFFLSGVVTLPNDVQFSPSYELTSQGDSEGCFNTDSTWQGRILTISRFIAIRLFGFTTCRRTHYLVFIYLTTLLGTSTSSKWIHIQGKRQKMDRHTPKGSVRTGHGVPCGALPLTLKSTQPNPGEDIHHTVISCVGN